MLIKFRQHVDLLKRSPGVTHWLVLVLPSPHAHNRFREIVIYPFLERTCAAWYPLIICQRPRGNDVISTCGGVSSGLLSIPKGLNAIQIACKSTRSFNFFIKLLFSTDAIPHLLLLKVTSATKLFLP